MTNLVLLPIPRQIEQRAGVFAVAGSRRIVLLAPRADDLLFAAQRLQGALTDHAGVHWALAASAHGPAEDSAIILKVDPAASMHEQGYELEIGAARILLIARAPVGVFYGVCTLIQILEQSRARRAVRLPCLRIVDAPDYAARGVMLDISRDRVPTMETLYGLVDMLASWKVNQLQLYTEHTFAYRNHPDVVGAASPVTEEEVLSLDAFCRRRHIDLVPNQNSFGHMHRWLKHDAYRPLAEVPEMDQNFWWGKGPFSLCPTDPRSLDLVRDLYDALLPHFSSAMFNVGCDETFDLGKGRSKAEAEQRGVGRVYLDFLQRIYADVKARGRTMQFWGDIIIKHPELIPELPKDAIALEWGYEAGHPFDENGARFAAAGVPFYVCPGTSSWNCIAGRSDNALANLGNAARNGLKHGAVGYLITDWGDNGHWQSVSASYLGFAYGAGVSWCVEANEQMQMAGALNRFAFRDPSGVMGKLAYEMGNVYQSLGPYFRNASGLVRVLLAPAMCQDGDVLGYIRALGDGGLSRASFQNAMRAIDRAMKPLPRQRMQRADADQIVAEFEVAADLLHHACGLGLLAFSKDEREARTLRRDLRADLRRLVARYRKVWLGRSREGGLEDSVARLQKIAEVYAQ